MKILLLSRQIQKNALLFFTSRTLTKNVYNENTSKTSLIPTMHELREQIFKHAFNIYNNKK